uniref:Uncharacterized protein n=1 Tax=Caenorhabditis japonica TaxID=281687 RepID=A0A8R1INT3_CAEJA
MRWGDPPLTIFKPIELPDFTMTNFSTSNKFQLYAAGYWSELNVNFLFRRRSGWYLLQGYIPTYMTVFISWIPFYLGPKAIPARTMIGQFSSADYIKKEKFCVTLTLLPYPPNLSNRPNRSA